MGRWALLATVLCGCKQLLGFDSPSPLAEDAPGDTALVIDSMVDTPVDLPVGQFAVSFRDGVNNYSGTRDTYVDSSNPNNDSASDNILRVRTNQRHVLIQFTGIIGNAAGQIPANVTILDAQLDLTLNSVQSTGTIYEVTTAWVEMDTFNTFGGAPGINGDFGAVTTGFAPGMTGLVSFDVKTVVEKWVAGTLPNNGVIIVGEGGSGGDTNLHSSEDGIPNDRPQLRVTYSQ